LAESLESQRYRLDTKPGLFVRPSCETAILPHTLIDIAFLRPTYLHYHRDVEETIRVINGCGSMLVSYPLPQRMEFKIDKGDERNLLPHTQHAFRPDKETCLELRIACDGILDPKKEIPVERFDKVFEWVKYFSNTNN